MAHDFTQTPNHKFGTLNRECETSILSSFTEILDFSGCPLSPTIPSVKGMIPSCLKARLKEKDKPKNSALCLSEFRFEDQRREMQQSDTLSAQ